MRDQSISSKAGNESIHQAAPQQQEKETAAVSRQGQAAQAGAPVGFDFGAMPMFPPSKQNPNLPQDLQANMESSFGHDFSGVGIHRNSQQAQRLNALAYTQGESIHFAPGEFNPHSESGRNLIGHEFAHVVQQRSGVVQPTAVLGKGLPLNDNQGLEHEADSLGKKAVQGEAVMKYQSPSLGMRSGMRTVQAKRGVIQRAVTTWGGTWDTDQYDKRQDKDSLGVAYPASSGIRGVDIKLKFTPNTNVNAELIGLTQVANGFLGGRYISPGQNRSISSADAININGSETDEGMAIDRISSYNNPIYPVDSQPSTRLDDTNTDPIWGQHGWNNPSKIPPKQDAILIDKPTLGGAANDSRQIFETTAVATRGVQVGTYYGSVRWGWRTDAGGNFDKINLSVVSQGVPSSTFMKSAELWNASKDSNNNDTVDLPIADVKVTTSSIQAKMPIPMRPVTIPIGTRVVFIPNIPYINPKIRIVDGPMTGRVFEILPTDVANISDER